MRLADLGERKARGNARSDAALAKELEHGQHVVHARAAQPQQVQLQADQVGGGERQALAALLAGDDQGSAEPHHAADEAQQRRAAGVIDGVVDAFATGEPRHVLERLVFVAGDDHRIGAELAQDRGLRFMPGGGDDARAGELRQLQGRLAHAAGRAGEQHVVAELDAQPVGHHAVRRRERPERDAGLLEVDAARQRQPHRLSRTRYCA